LCVILASRAGSGFDASAQDLAVAVELVHAATLLHDDVVDVGDLRRGAPAARKVYGNAVSIFAGDWLLIEALRRVRRARVEGALDRLLEIIDEMILAESLQLENRGQLATDLDTWLRVVEGKTAALFRWAMFAGARAGGLDEGACSALEAYGQHLGVAFQAVDDVLDLTGDTAVTGKAVLTDLREGKLTWPVIVGLERDPHLHGLLDEMLRGPTEGVEDPRLQTRVLTALAESGAVRDCMAYARNRVAQAVDCLSGCPKGPSVEALVTAAHAVVNRQK
jgi:octaprenyl-diphosphate synthase